MRTALFLLTAALFAIGHAVMFPQGALANLFGWATPMGTFEPVRFMVGLLAFALGAVTLLTGLQPRKRREAEDLNLGLQSSSVAPKPIILTETPNQPLAPFPAEPVAAAPLMAAAVAPVAPEAVVESAPEPPVVAAEPAPVEMTPPLAETEAALHEPDAPAAEAIPATDTATPATLETPQQAIAASLREALATPPGERRRAQLRDLSQQVAALAASLAALADEKREEPSTPVELASMGPAPEPEAVLPVEPEAEPEQELEAPPPTALETARAELEAAPASLSAKSAVAAALESAPERGLAELEEAVELRRQVARVSIAQTPRLDLAASVEKLADAYLSAGDVGRARDLLADSLADLKPLVAQQTRYADLVYNARVGLAVLR